MGLLCVWPCIINASSELDGDRIMFFVGEYACLYYLYFCLLCRVLLSLYVSRLLWPWLFGKGFVDDPSQVTGGAASELDGAI